MAGEVTVMGDQPNVGDIDESLAVFRKHHQNVADVLLNLSEGKRKDDSRPSYEFQAWPKMVYHADGGHAIVNDEKEMRELEKKGYRKEPFLKAQVAELTPHEQSVALKAQNKALMEQVNSQADLIRKMNEKLEVLSAKVN